MSPSWNQNRERQRDYRIGHDDPSQNFTEVVKASTVERLQRAWPFAEEGPSGRALLGGIHRQQREGGGGTESTGSLDQDRSRVPEAPRT